MGLHDPLSGLGAGRAAQDGTTVTRHVRTPVACGERYLSRAAGGAHRAARVRDRGRKRLAFTYTRRDSDGLAGIGDDKAE